jgi:uridine monophosphate synthetase
MKRIMTNPINVNVNVPAHHKHQLTYIQRSHLAKNPVAKRCFEIMHKKKTNLCIAADVLTPRELLHLAETIGPHICVFKTHIDTLQNFSYEVVRRLHVLSEMHDFIIFEDRKFADIGNTVSLQYAGGMYEIASWSHMTNAHIVPGDGVISGLKKVGKPLGRGCLLLAEMSSQGTLACGDYTRQAVDMALKHDDFVMGFISTNPKAWPQYDLLKHKGMIHMTPGVQLARGGDCLGQRYLTPHDVICERGSDVIIVGRGIYEAEDPLAEAIKYKDEGWKAYMFDSHKI